MKCKQKLKRRAGLKTGNRYSNWQKPQTGLDDRRREKNQIHGDEESIEQDSRISVCHHY